MVKLLVPWVGTLLCKVDAIGQVLQITKPYLTRMTTVNVFPALPLNISLQTRESFSSGMMHHLSITVIM